jgi:hypothetical protein
MALKIAIVHRLSILWHCGMFLAIFIPFETEKGGYHPPLIRGGMGWGYQNQKPPQSLLIRGEVEAPAGRLYDSDEYNRKLLKYP